MLASGSSFDLKETIIAASSDASGGPIVISDAAFLFNAEFSRTGSDLILTGSDGQRLVVAGYFTGERPLALFAPGGEMLSGETITALVKSHTPTHYALAGAPAAAAPQIGAVDKVSGGVTVVRNGASVALNAGDQILKGDVILTADGASAAIMLVDGTALNLGANTRMVMNEFVYDPNSTNNSSMLSLVTGSFAFVSGQVAKTGGLNFETPVATMGIRGTTGGAACASSCEFTATADAKDGHASTYTLSYNGQVIGTVSVANNAIVGPSGPGQIPIVNFVSAANADPALSALAQQLTTNYPQMFVPAPPPPAPAPGQPTPQGGSNGGSSTPQNILLQLPQQATPPVVFPHTDPGVVVPPVSPPPPVTISVVFTPPPQSNQPPVFNNPIANQLSESDHVFNFTIPPNTFSDPDTPITSLTITASLADGSPLPGWLIFDPATQQFSGTPPANAAGEIALRVVVSDGTSSVANVFTLTVNPVTNPVNVAPIVVTTVPSAPPSVTDNGTPKAIDPGLTVADADSQTLAGATVSIASGAQNGDSLTIGGATHGSLIVSGGRTIQFSYDSNTHVLTLSGVAALGDYQAVLRAVSFSNTGDHVDNSTRTITFQVNDGGADHNNSDIASSTIVLNHLPVAVADIGAVTEDAASTVVTGNVLGNDTDVDNADTHRVSAVAGATDDGLTFTIVGVYGTLVVTKATGAYTYTLHNGQANVQALADGQTVTDVFSYTNSDSNGASASATLTISVHGSNDAPTVDLTPIITEVPIPDLTQHPGTDPASQDLIAPAISQDGRWVVFFSNQGLPTGNDDSSPQGDVFLYDRLSGVTRVLTDDQHIQNRPTGEHYSGFSVSADGSTAVFRGSQQVDQQNGPPIETDHIYVYDRNSDTTRLLTNPDNGHVYEVNDEPRLAGLYLIAFADSDFGNGSQPPTQHLRVTDLAGHLRTDLTLANLGISDPNPGNPNQSLQFVQPDISGNGRFLTFWAIEQQFNPGGGITSLGDATLYTVDRTTGQHHVIATTSAGDGDPWWASMSNDGRFVVFQSDSDPLDVQVGGVANHTLDIFLFDRLANGGNGGIVGITDRSDFQANYAGGGFGSGRASISPDGRFVIFASDATNLVAGDTNGLGDTFVYNIQTQTFSRVSVGPDGALQGDDASVLGADISFAGFIAAFGSTANNFVNPVETDGKSNVFVVDRSAGTAGAVIEDNTTPGTASGSASPNTLSTHGAFRFNDVDLSDVHTVSVTGVLIDTSGAPGFVAPPGGLGTLTPSVIDSTNSGHGQIAWDFVVDNAAVQGLNDFQIVRQTYTVQISDGHGGTVTQTVTIRIAGENDAAVISGTTSGNVTEAGGVNNNIPNRPTVGGTLTDTDVDNPANTFQAVTAPRLSDHGFGNFTLTAAGVWAYTLDNNNAQVQALNAGNHLTDTFTVRTIDGAAQQVTVTINGANDAASITGATATGAVPSSALTPTAASYLTASHDLINGLGGTAGFGEHTLPGNDDGSTGAINLDAVFGTSGLNFFGTHYHSLFINNNGNVTFNGPSSTFTPFQINAGISPIIAPFLADVDTRGGSASPTLGGHSTGSNLVYWDLDSVNQVLTVTWDDVGYFGAHKDHLNAFQLQLVGLGNGDFDIVFRYEDINWTTGDASGGSGGLGGTVARAGYSAGDGNPSHFFELPQSGNQQAMLNIDTTPGNTNTAGVQVFQVESGAVTTAPVANGAIQFADRDSGDTHTSVAHAAAANYLGTFTLDPVNETNQSVAWHFALNSNDVNTFFDPSAQQIRQQFYDVTIGDGHPGGSATERVGLSVGSTSSDTFAFAPGAGQELVFNFATSGSLDRIDLQSFSDVNLNLQSINNNHDTLIDLDHGDSVTLIGVQAAQLVVDQHVIHGAILVV
jgi:VCBS repeat-containing protein